MKHYNHIRVLLLFCLAVITADTLAQNSFAPLGAEWWYYNRRINTIYSVHETLYQNKVIKDTTIMGKDCRLISQAAYVRDHFPPSSPYWGNATLRDLFIYDTKDTVFVFNENFNQFTPLYIFNLKEGDTVCLPVIPDIIYNTNDSRIHPFTNDRSFCFIIDSIRIAPYGTVALKTFYNHSYSTHKGQDGPNYNWQINQTSNVFHGAYAEKIGGLNAGLLPTLFVGGVERALDPSDNAYTTFRCYTDTTIHIGIYAGGTCDSLPPAPVAIETEKVSEKGFYIYPNPARDKITIRSITAPTASDTHITLEDITGKVLNKSSIKKGTIITGMSLTNIPPGIYILSIRNGQSLFSHKLIVQ